jgi:hypothetical protein
MASCPTRLTVSTSRPALIAVTAVAMEALSRDH